jgi:hypothetical protein
MRHAGKVSLLALGLYLAVLPEAAGQTLGGRGKVADIPSKMTSAYPHFLDIAPRSPSEIGPEREHANQLFDSPADSTMFQLPVRQHSIYSNNTTATGAVNRVHVYQTWADSVWVNSTKDSITTDAQGHGISYVYDQWDGRVWVHLHRYTFINYDVNGNLTAYSDQGWSGNDWTNGWVYRYYYDGSSRPTRGLTQQWSGSDWVNVDLVNMTYDALGHLATSLQQTWSNGAWVNAQQSNYAYDLNGRRSTYLYQTWDGSVWTNVDLNSYTYYLNGANELSHLHQTWNGSTWIDVERSTNTYGVDGRPSNYLYQTWSASAWVDAYLESYAYAASGYYSSVIKKWGDGSGWGNWLKYIYTEDANGLVTTVLMQFWNGSVGQNHDLESYTYDANGRLMNGVSQSWTQDGWKTYSQYTYTYDADGRAVSRLHRYSYAIAGVYGLWNESRDDYTYQQATWVGVRDPQEAPIHYALSENAPNPFSSQTQVSYTLATEGNVRVTIYDVVGREIATLVNGRQGPGAHSVKWNARLVPSGVYLYRLKAGSFVQTRKMLLLK